jgi:alkylation response protein AidB-like acyl-CoA dehydrogenase
VRDFGGLGYSPHTPFEPIYRHHRRSRITKGTEEIQMPRVGGHQCDFMKQQTSNGIMVGDWNAYPCWI